MIQFDFDFLATCNLANCLSNSRTNWARKTFWQLVTCNFCQQFK